MNIKTTDQTVPLFYPVVNLFKSSRRSLVVSTILVVIALIATGLGSIYYGMHLYKVKQADSYDEFLENAIQAKLDIVPNMIKGYTSSNAEKLTIDIKHKHFQKLAYKREVALQRGILLTSSDDYVPARISYQDKSAKVKLRLKGDWTDHLLGEKWSYRIKVRGDNTIFGMKHLSIHHPRARNYVYEWLFHRALKREGVLAPRYDFVEVVLNGKNLGIYALEEHFEKRLIENQQHREGPIIKLNEDLLWADRAFHPWKRGGESDEHSFEGASHVDVFKINTIFENPKLYDQFLIAHDMLESFRCGELPAHKVFDIPKLARLFALSDLMGAIHSLNWHNLRFYYNPITALLEPIGFDANAGKEITQIVGANRVLEGAPKKFKDLVFSDTIFFEEYLSTLERISSNAYLENLLNETRDELEQKLNIVYKEFPHFHYTERVFSHNQRVIRSVLNPLKSFHAYFDRSSNGEFELQFGNIQSLPIELVSVSFKDSIVFKPVERSILQARLKANSIDYRSVAFEIPPGLAWSDTMSKYLKANFKVLGTSVLKSDVVFSWPRKYDAYRDNNIIRQPANAGEFEFVHIDESKKRIIIKPGDWKVERNLIFPKGYEVVCGAGTRIAITNSATILSHSRLNFQGSEEHPIIFHSSDSTGQGIVVIDAGELSELRYVRFDNLSNPAQNGWSLTGAVSFYQSPVNILGCEFVNNRSEDALNVIRSEFSIEKSLFSSTFSDAFDGDFTKGKVINSSFVNCGNDAIDVSGSAIEVENVVIKRAGDKGLSTGENSQMAASQVEISNTEIAVASKDMSDMVVKDIKVSDCEIGFTAYQKKPEFAAANIVVKGLQQTKTTIPYLIEEGSTLNVDGKEIPPSRKNVKDILYGVEFGKSTKR